MMNAIALDDEPPALSLLASYCEKLDYVDLKRTFTVPSDALRYIRKFPVDLIFLDIQMPGILGTEFRKSLDPDIMVIFTTAYSNYAVEGFDLNVMDFLLKPYPFARFQQATQKANQYFSIVHQTDSPENTCIYLRADYGLIKVPLNSLLYIEGLEDYCKIYFADSPPLIFRITMKSLIEKLPSARFVRVHRSFIVNIAHCQNLRGNTITIRGNQINIGRFYKKEVSSIFKNLL